MAATHSQSCHLLFNSPGRESTLSTWEMHRWPLLTPHWSCCGWGCRGWGLSLAHCTHSLSAGWLSTKLSPRMVQKQLPDKPITFPVVCWEAKVAAGEVMGALRCQGLNVFSPQLDLKAPSSRMWLQASLLASPQAGLELAGLPTPPRASAPHSYGRALHGLRLLRKVQLTHGPNRHHTAATQVSPNLCTARQPCYRKLSNSLTPTLGCPPLFSTTEEPWACVHLPFSSGGMWVIRRDVLLMGGAGYSWRYPLPLIP